MWRFLFCVLSAIIIAQHAAAQCGTFPDRVEYKYDELGRVYEVCFPNGDQISYSYDANGNRTQLAQTAVDETGGGSGNYGPPIYNDIMVSPVGGAVVIPVPPNTN